MMQWKGAFEETVKRRFGGFGTVKSSGQLVVKVKKYKGRQPINIQSDGNTVLTFIQQIPFVPPPPPPPAQIETDVKDDESGIDVYYEAETRSMDTQSQKPVITDN